MTASTRPRRLRHLVALSLALLSLSLFATPVAASAQVACGATIKADTTLSPSDPVVFDASSGTDTACRSVGLIVAGGVTLDCAGFTIKGRGVGTGIRVSGTAATIQNCVVDSFSIGIQLGGHGGHTVQNSTALNNKSNGLVIAGGQNTISGVTSQNNGGVGFQIRGAANQIGQKNVALDNGKAGFSISGNGQIFDTNYAVNNGDSGFTGSGNGSSFSASIAVGNKGAGFTYRGGTVNSPNDIGNSAAINNGGNGVVMSGTVDTAIDDGGNVGLLNGGTIQCQIAGAPCQ